MTSKILLLYTGGTFGMRPDILSNNRLVPDSWNEIITHMPSSNGMSFFDQFASVQFSFVTLNQVVDSSDILPEIWQEIAAIIQKHYNDHDGFVIIHGTDTLAYTASALSFVLEGLSKPVVITGSQLPVFDPRTDGIVNLSNAIYLAGYKSFDLPCIPEVCICFNDDVLRGNRAVKTSTFDFEGFYAPNFEHLGFLEQKIKLNDQLFYKSDKKQLRIIDKFSNHVVNVTVFPGYNPTVLIDLVATEKIKGIVLKTYGAGNIPNTKAWHELIKTCERHRVLLLATTQCPHGSIDIGKYESSKLLISDNVINGRDITSEAALTKLMWSIGNFDFEESKKVLNTNLRGEISTQ